MRLARYRLFVNAIRADETLAKLATSVELYRFFEGRWFAVDDSVVDIPTLTTVLLETRTKAVPWRSQKSLVTYFPISELDAVLVAEFQTASQKPTRDRVSFRVSACLENSQNAYNANHHDLSGLLNRKAFDEAVRSRLLQAQSNANAAHGITDATPAAVIGIVAIDIDHFKQINDTHGHLYGDVVLRLVAQRIEATCNELATQYASRISLLPSHPSGEEFLVLISGSVTPQDENEICEQIRSAVESRPLPDEGEWSKLPDRPSGAIAPHISERRVTISVGSASARVGTADEIDQVRLLLKSRADAALYRAKAAGRNRCVAYTDIVTRFGRVLEHDMNSRVVAIDIGRLAGVKIGQEFNVYSPIFSGDVPFLFKDGRTTKRMGTYPKISLCRVEVFDTQNEISFAWVEGGMAGTQIPAGALLESIPVGSIVHLISSSRAIASGLPAREDLEKRAVELTDISSDTTCLVFSLANHEALYEKQGIAYVNRVLASLYALAKQKLPATMTVGQLSPTKIAAVGRSMSLDDEVIRSIALDIEEKYESIPSIIIGVCTTEDIKGFQGYNDKTPLARGILTFAQFAEIEATRNKTSLKHFDSDTPGNVLHESRRTFQHENMKRDYDTLYNLGAVNVFADILFANGLAEIREFAQAEAAYSVIAEHKFGAHEASLEPIAMRQLGVIKYALKKYEEAVDLLRAGGLDSPKEVEVLKELGRYLPLYALAVFRTRGGGARTTTDAQLRHLLRSALDQPNIIMNLVARSEILAALALLDDGSLGPMPA